MPNIGKCLWAMGVWGLAAIVSAASPAAAEDLSGTYLLMAGSVNTAFSVPVMGQGSMTGEFKTVSGKLVLNGKSPERSTVSVTVDLASVQTDNPPVTDFLKSAAMFDTAEHPDATFHSTRVTLTGARSALVDGILSMRGKQARTQLTVKLDDNAKSGQVGFTVDGSFFRSLFGMDLGLPIYGDRVRLAISGKARKG